MSANNSGQTTAQTFFPEPLTFKSAILLCFFLIGLEYASGFVSYKLHLHVGFIPKILQLAAVILIVKLLGKDEAKKIFVWRGMPVEVFFSVLVMFYGFEILMSEFRNLFMILLPVPEGFFAGMFYEPPNLILLIISVGLFPGFTEEVFFRGVIARKFFRIYSPVKSIILSSVLFGMMHINPWQTVNAFFGGLFLGWVYWRYRSIWLSMFFHAYYNVIISLIPLPYTLNYSYDYTEEWRHPLWFIIMGAIFFVVGLLLVIVLSRKDMKTNL